MRILFGPEHDGLHIDPMDPGAYEWWYFDAISEDERYVLVVIFFLGTPMSPYYKAVVDEKKPIPQDWCGVFYSLHERTERHHYRERAYAYNIYSRGEFSSDGSVIRIGNSSIVRSPNPNAAVNSDSGCDWHISIREPGLWQGELRANLTFSTKHRLSAASIDAADPHTWVCAAPQCQITGTMPGPNRNTEKFVGSGYHDHNFGRLPWHEVSYWFWARTRLKSDDDFSYQGDLVAFTWQSTRGSFATYLLHLAADGEIAFTKMIDKTSIDRYSRGAYGLRFPSEVCLCDTIEGEVPRSLFAKMSLDHSNPRPVFSEAPFYRRFLVATSTAYHRDDEDVTHCSHGDGIGEVFCPSKLCGPIASRAIWTRMRRRS